MKISSLCCLILLLAGTAAEAATVYRWVDGNGRVHFSDQPRGNFVETLQVRTGPRYREESPADEEGQSGAKTESPPPAGEEKVAEAGRGKGEDAAAQARRRKEMRRKNCQIARENLERNARISRMYRVGADGERHYLDEAEREAVLEKSRRQVREWCD